KSRRSLSRGLPRQGRPLRQDQLRGAQRPRRRHAGGTGADPGNAGRFEEDYCGDEVISKSPRIAPTSTHCNAWALVRPLTFTFEEKGRAGVIFWYRGGECKGWEVSRLRGRRRPGHGRPGRRPPDPGKPGQGPGWPLKLQGRQVGVMPGRD